MPIKSVIALVLLLGTARMVSFGQSADSMVNKVVNLPSGFFNKVQSKTAQLDAQLTKQTQSYLQSMSKEEGRLRKKMARLDSTDTSAARKSATLFSGNPEKQYSSLLQKLKSDTASAMKIMHGQYLPYADSLQGMLKFLQANPQMLNTSKFSPTDVQNTLTKVTQLQNKLQDAGEIQQYMQQRQTQIHQYLSQYSKLPSSLTGSYTNYNKKLYYYSEQVKAYKEALNDPDKRMQLAMTVLNKVPAFTNFMKNNSMLSSALNLPGSYNPSVSGLGLSTRDQVLAAFENKMGKSGGGVSGPSVGAGGLSGGAGGSSGGVDVSSITQQSMQSATDQVDQLRAKLSSLGNSTGPNVDIPNFNPNSQKTKSLLKRLEYGFNIQTVHSTYFYPSTTDIGLSLGYKLNDKNVIGIGASYKLGWGQDLSHISLTSQGMSLRSFVDINLKKSFYVSGGFEYNYQQPLKLADVPSLKNWQPSGLVGISKIVSLKTKVLSKTNLQLLWDFLSYQQVPKPSPFVFRVGYSF